MPAPLIHIPFVQDLRRRDPATGLLVMPASVTVVTRGSTVPAALFTDSAGSTSLANPLPTGVAPPTSTTGPLGGVDTSGNAGFWISPGLYDLIVDGSRYPYDIGVSSADVSGHLANTTDAHGFQAWAAGQFPATTDVQSFMALVKQAGRVKL